MTDSSLQDTLRTLPQVNELLRTEYLAQLDDALPHAVVVEAARTAIEDARNRVFDGESAPTKEEIALSAASIALQTSRPSLRRVINATGVVIHTNLGRSVLSKAALKAVQEVAGGYSTLEYDAQSMKRGSRHAHYEQLLRLVTGAEAAMAVNNNAAAVLLVLNEFAKGREAIVSRGELVEIGGSFRIPDIMELSGAHMVEVGTTNKTHASDYSRAINEKTGLLLKVHPSNYRMAGFTETVPLKELKKLANVENQLRTQERDAKRDTAGPRGLAKGTCPDDLLVYEDQGSGALMRLDCFGDYAEPTVRESLRNGCDLISFSGDKLLGGPQAGIIVGRNNLIERLKANPLARALRLDKMTIAALEETLRLYLDPARAKREIPTIAMLSATPDELEPRAKTLAEAILKAAPKSSVAVDIVDEVSRAGGGALPLCDIPTRAVRVGFLCGTALECERALILHRKTPVIGRIKKDALLLDVRTLVDDEEVNMIAQALAQYLEGASR